MIEKAYSAWADAESLRARRARFKRYTYGDQWSDYVADLDGKFVREDILVRRQGHNPITNNLIRQLVKTVVGRYRTIA
ncbi:MAG: hypothetical protein K2F79_04255, partial [Muribaculaceae bacterium]|nr:hypothetical protein [Muribaculaceae bacterium]